MQIEKQSLNLKAIKDEHEKNANISSEMEEKVEKLRNDAKIVEQYIERKVTTWNKSRSKKMDAREASEMYDAIKEIKEWGNIWILGHLMRVSQVS